MSLAEIKERTSQLTAKELRELALHIDFLRRVNDPKWRAKIAKASQGPFHTEEEVRAVHERLLAEGR